MYFFQDVDEDEVAELLSTSCKKNVTAQLTVPMLPSSAAGRRPSGGSGSNNQTGAGVDSPRLEELHVHMDEAMFKYDVTWFSQHFHELDQVRMRAGLRWFYVGLLFKIGISNLQDRYSIRHETLESSISENHFDRKSKEL